MRSRTVSTVARIQFRVSSRLESPTRVQLGHWPHHDLVKFDPRARDAKDGNTLWDVPLVSMQLLHEKGQWVCSDLVLYCFREEPAYRGKGVLARPVATSVEFETDVLVLRASDERGRKFYTVTVRLDDDTRKDLVTQLSLGAVQPGDI